MKALLTNVAASCLLIPNAKAQRYTVAKFTLLSALALIALIAPLRAEFLYVSSYYNGLLSFSINSQTGALTKLPGSPLLTPAGINFLTLDHTGRLLYATTDSAIYGYRIASNGQLVPLPGSPYKVTGGRLAVDPYNRFLYATANNDSIYVYRIEPNGSLRTVAGSPFSSPGAGSLAVDPFGRFIYTVGTAYDLVNGSKGVLSVYSVLGNGVLRPVPGSPFSTGKLYNVSVVAENTGRFIYVATDLQVTIETFQVAANGVLSKAPGSGNVEYATWCQNLGYNPVGGYLYLLTFIGGFSINHINSVTGLPEPIGSAVATIRYGTTDSVCVNHNGKFVYVGNANVFADFGLPMTLHGFKVGPTGLLTPVPGSPYYPLGTEGSTTEGLASSMVVAP